MDELYADQQAGREPADPARLFTDAGQIKAKVPLDQFPGSCGLAGQFLEAAPHREQEGPLGEMGTL